MQLRASSTVQSSLKSTIRTVDNPAAIPKAVAHWVKNIEELHLNKPPPTVMTTSRLPETESLMQEWPDDFLKVLATCNLPPASINLTLLDYARVVCALLDVPVNDNIIQSLHSVFALYLEFKNSAQFKDMPQ